MTQCHMNVNVSFVSLSVVIAYFSHLVWPEPPISPVRGPSPSSGGLGLGRGLEIGLV